MKGLKEMLVSIYNQLNKYINGPKSVSPDDQINSNYHPRSVGPDQEMDDNSFEEAYFIEVKEYFPDIEFATMIPEVQVKEEFVIILELL